MGTRRTTLAGRASARKTGMDKYAGVARRVRNRRRSSSTSTEIIRRAKVKKMLEPTDILAIVIMVLETINVGEACIGRKGRPDLIDQQ
jgi:hypothetical protein